MAGTLDGKDISAHTAFKLDSISVTDVQSIEVEEDDIKFIYPTYGSTVLTEAKIKHEKLKLQILD